MSHHIHKQYDDRHINPLDTPLTNYVVVDVETTGFKPEEGARLIEIGAVRVTGGRITDTFSQLINPNAPIPAHITELTGITQDMVDSQPALVEVMTMFDQWLNEDDVLLAHNATFDMHFLDVATSEVWTGHQRFEHAYLDTLEMSRLLHPEFPSHKVSELIRAYNVGEVEEHRGLADAMQEQDLYQRMCKEAFIVGVTR